MLIQQPQNGLDTFQRLSDLQQTKRQTGQQLQQILTHDMEYIKVHTFTTEQEAQQAIDLINEGEGIPVSPDAITRTYCTYEVAENTIFIRADEVTQKYIETTTEITIE